MDDFVNAESSILLKTGVDSLELKFFISSLPYKIKMLDIVLSNCKKIEIYTEKFEQYLKTAYGEIIDDTDDIVTCYFNLNLETLTDHLTLKFISQSTEFWIYGINLKLFDASSEVHPFNSSINMQNVESLLKNSSVELTDNAKMCKSFIQNYSHILTPNQPDITDVIEKNIEKSLSKMFAQGVNLNSFLIRDSSAKKDQSSTDSPAIQPELSASPSILSGMTSIIQSEFGKMETNLMRRMEENFKELERKQNERFDEILMQFKCYDKSLGFKANEKL